MKKILITLLCVIMAVTLCTSLYSCGDDTTKCTSHTDADSNGKCDTCGETVTPPACTSHVDADGDGKCDSCGETVTPPACTNHIDADGDDKCDSCGGDMPDDGIMSHAEFMAAPADAPVCVETYIQAKQGWWVKDGVGVASFYTQNSEGGFFLYDMPCTEEEYATLTEGTNIAVNGYKVIWNGLHEIGDATFEIIEGNSVADATDITDVLATDDIVNYQSMKFVANDLTVLEFKDGAAFGYGWDGSGTDGNDIYLKLSDGTNTYSFVIETYFTGSDSEVYATAKTLKVGDVITVNGFVYWYEGFQAHVSSIEFPMTHEAFMSAAADEPVWVDTYVQAKQGWWEKDGVGVASFYTQNAEGGFFLYDMPCTEEEYAMLTVGTRIAVRGYKVIWNALHEIGDATFEIIEGSYVAEAADITDVLATDDIANYQSMKFIANELTVLEFKDGAAFGYGWDGSGTDGNDIYLKLSDGTNTYSFVIETYFMGADTEVYAAAKALEVGDTVTVEGFVYWYEGFQAHLTAITVIEAE